MTTPPNPNPGHKWRSHRKLIAPTFHLNVLKSFIDLFNENSRQVVKKLSAEAGKTFDAHDYMSEATVEILLGKCSSHAHNGAHPNGQIGIQKPRVLSFVVCGAMWCNVAQAASHRAIARHCAQTTLY